MIDKLMKSAAEEAEAKAFCDTEMAKSKAKAKKLASTADMHSVRIEKAEARKAKLNQAIKILEGEVSEIDKSQEEATKLRQEEHEKFLKASADYDQSAEAVANAISTLQQYYSQGAFAQRSKQPDFEAAKTDIGTTIISMLEVAESDFTTLLAEAKAEESAAAEEYDQQTQQNKVSKTSKMTEAKEKASEAKQVEMNLLNYKEDYASTSKEVDAVHTYIDKLKPQCETKVMTYEERKAKREAEIGGLKEALTILEDS